MLKGVVREAMTFGAISVHESSTVLEVLGKMKQLRVELMPVHYDANRWRGLALETELTAHAANGRGGYETAVGELASPELWLAPEQPLADAFDRMGEVGLGRLPVVIDGIISGMVRRADVRSFLRVERELGFPLEDLIDTVSPHDLMFDSSWANYVMIGASGLRCIRRALRRTGATPQRILDFGCGHGRVLRFIRAAFPDAELTACDVDRDAVSFCARTFGAQPVYSNDGLD